MTAKKHTKLIPAAIAALAIAGCGSTSESTPTATPTATTQPAAPRPAPHSNAPRGSERARIDLRNFENARDVCRLFPARRIAREYGVPPGSDDVTIALAYARVYRPGFRQPVFEGCLAGIQARAAR